MALPLFFHLISALADCLQLQNAVDCRGFSYLILIFFTTHITSNLITTVVTAQLIFDSDFCHGQFLREPTRSVFLLHTNSQQTGPVQSVGSCALKQEEGLHYLVAVLQSVLVGMHRL